MKWKSKSDNKLSLKKFKYSSVH